MMTGKKISIVVPCYKDEGNINELVRRLKFVLEKITPLWEIIYINDDSPDNSAKVLAEIAEDDKRITVLNFSRNFGVMSVFMAGMEYASGDAVILMDGDLQDPPELIPEFIKKWQEGYFVVYGTRESRDEKWYRKIGYKLFYSLWNHVSEIDVPFQAGEFALIDAKVVGIITSIQERDIFLRGIRTWVGFPQTSVPYHRPSRYDGDSTQNLLSYITWAFKAVTSFSVKPLKLISVAALCMACALLLLVIFNFILFLMGIRGPEGFFTLLITIVFGTSIQLLALAIISEYIIHIMREVKNRPRYIVQSILNKDQLGKKNERLL